MDRDWMVLADVLIIYIRHHQIGWGRLKTVPGRTYFAAGRGEAEPERRHRLETVEAGYGCDANPNSVRSLAGADRQGRS
jgi:hypothetical protein